MLIIVSGLQGAGKTTVARRISERANAVLLRTDVIRKELMETPEYTEDAKQKAYEEMFSQARKLLDEKRNVVLDATFRMEKYREQARRAAGEAGTDFEIVEVVCSEAAAQKRIEERTGDESEAQFEQYLQSKRLFEPITEKHATVDNSGSLADLEGQLDKLFLVGNSSRK